MQIVNTFLQIKHNGSIVKFEREKMVEIFEKIEQDCH